MTDRTKRLVLIIIGGAVACVSTVIGRGHPEYTLIANIGTVLGWLLALIVVVYNHMLGTPYKTNTQQHPWHHKGPVGNPQDVYCFIPKSDHKKGDNPTVKLTKLNGDPLHYQFRITKQDGGDVYVRFPENYLPQLNQLDPLKIEISG